MIVSPSSPNFCLALSASIVNHDGRKRICGSVLLKLDCRRVAFSIFTPLCFTYHYPLLMEVDIVKVEKLSIIMSPVLLR